MTIIFYYNATKTKQHEIGTYATKPNTNCASCSFCQQFFEQLHCPRQTEYGLFKRAIDLHNIRNILGPIQDPQYLDSNAVTKLGMQKSLAILSNQIKHICLAPNVTREAQAIGNRCR